MLGAWFTDVLVADAHPLVGRRVEHHLLDPAPVQVLDVGPVAQHLAVVLELVGQVVAQLLELAGRQQARPAARGDVPLEALARVGGAEERGQLGFELGDLIAQGLARGALVDLDAGNRLECQKLIAIEYFAHNPSLPGFSRWYSIQDASPRSSAALQSASSTLNAGTPLTRTATSRTRSVRSVGRTLCA